MKKNKKLQLSPRKKPSPKSSNFTLITGASAGIGEATAYILAKKKNSLVLLARRTDRLERIKKNCLKLGASEVHIFKCDITQSKDIQKVILVLKKQKILITNLINNAGLALGVNSLQDSKMSEINSMIDTNIKGLAEITQALLYSIIQTKGHIVNLGSVAGHIVYPGGAIYCATKFAVGAITQGLRHDLKGTGVRVTQISPGMVNSEFSLVRLKKRDLADAVYKGMMPLSPEDIAQNILWCLEQPRHVNIQEVIIYPTDQASVGHVHRS